MEKGVITDGAFGILPNTRATDQTHSSKHKAKMVNLKEMARKRV